MPESWGDIARRRVQDRFGPHGLNPRYRGLYVVAGRHISGWLLANSTPKALCEAIGLGAPVLQAALGEITDSALDVARKIVRDEIRDLGPGDYEQVLLQIRAHAPQHYVILASGPEWRCPYCKGGHHDWALAQLEATLSFLRNGTAGQ